MAPTLSRRGALPQDFGGVLWDRSTSGSSDGSPIQAQDASAPSTVRSSVYLGIGIGLGGAILVAVVAVIIQIVRKRAQALADA